MRTVLEDCLLDICLSLSPPRNMTTSLQKDYFSVVRYNLYTKVCTWIHAVEYWLLVELFGK